MERTGHSKQLVDAAQSRFRDRVAGRRLGELKEAELLLMELLLSAFDYIDRAEERIVALETEVHILKTGSVRGLP